ncbi:MAG: hypothetical protein LBU65_17565 [Planctomycetaceae bacterium]|nr:hypothetical protein [Planctomycetaceae bacterium]
MHPVFYSIPLVILFSLCYAGTRHENISAIVRHAAHFAGWTFFAMVVVVLIIEFILAFVKV